MSEWKPIDANFKGYNYLEIQQELDPSRPFSAL